MADRMSTARRMDRARDNAAVTRATNGKDRRKADASRAKRMAALIKGGTFPYTPAVQSWISVQLSKPFTKVTEADAKGLLK